MDHLNFLDGVDSASVDVPSATRDGLEIWVERLTAPSARSWRRAHIAARLVAKWAGTPDSRSAVAQLIENPRFRRQDCLVAPEDFRTLHEFFDRSIDRLQTAHHAAAAPGRSLISSPCDGCIQQVIEGGRSAHLKDADYPWESIAPHGWPGSAASTLITHRVRPYDYHGVVSPIEGTVVSVSERPAMWSLLGDQPRSQYFLQRRVVFEIESATTHLAVVAIGGLLVQTVEVLCSEGDKLAQGDILGRFHVGGSSVALLISGADFKASDDILSLVGRDYEVEVLIGETIGSAPSA